MKTKVLASAAILFWLCCSTAMAQWPHNTYGNRTGWEAEVGTRILERPGTDNNFTLVTLDPTNQVAFNSNDASELATSAGVDFRFLKQTCYDASWEVRGFINTWDNTETRTGSLVAPLFTPAVLAPLVGPDRFDYRYESELFSLELNYKRAVRPGLTAMVGPRYVSLRETVTINSAFNPIAFNLDSLTTANNYMPGLGFGLENRTPLTRDLFFVGSVKGAILANFASTNTTTTGLVTGGAPVSTTIFDDSKSHAAGVGELSARIHYDVSPGTVSLYAGYEALWLDGVALAPAQLLSSVNPPPVLNTSNTAFAHGLVIGGMVRF